ncbi:MAG: phosphoribosylformylglycinamidine cyclo-ligase [Thermodesulfobacteriota bacterium]|nr:phosphoribosylformylglycinamidine cyclo-ligase [Thermodesulfobacteriota bacterium]|tara:strand:+ start:1991 stop:2998 length:1008 start_codon:yes stop_codon:yes gene_type:complete
MKKKTTYQNSGVSVNTGDKFVKSIQPYVKKTLTKEVVGSTTSFAALYSIEAKQKKIKKPILVACTDGVGTKIDLGIRTRKVKGLGIDLVAMCVNDLICSGATPLFFLDYLSTSKLEIKYHSEVIKGVAEGCIKSGCSLIGGETAEMPGMYKSKDFDLAGFALGIVDRNYLIDSKKVKKGDLLIGIQSNGIHSNGYSLIRKLFFGRKSKFLNNKKLTNTLMKPTRIYVDLIDKIKNKIQIKGIAHITGGGLLGNIPRIIPKNLDYDLYPDSWKIPEIFNFISHHARLNNQEMLSVYNMGIGMVLCINENDLQKLDKAFKAAKEKYYIIGRVITKRK